MNTFTCFHQKQRKIQARQWKIGVNIVITSLSQDYPSKMLNKNFDGIKCCYDIISDGARNRLVFYFKAKSDKFSLQTQMMQTLMGKVTQYRLLELSIIYMVIIIDTYESMGLSNCIRNSIHNNKVKSFGLSKV